MPYRDAEQKRARERARYHANLESQRARVLAKYRREAAETNEFRRARCGAEREEGLTQIGQLTFDGEV